MLNVIVLATLSVLPANHFAGTDLTYYEGHWACAGSASGKSGALTVEHKLNDLFFVFTWESDAQGTDTSDKTVTYAAWSANAARYVRNGFNTDGSRVHLVSDGFDGDTIIWTGEVNVRGGTDVHVRITEKKVDASSYTSIYETSTDGQTYVTQDTGSCKRSS